MTEKCTFLLPFFVHPILPIATFAIPGYICIPLRRIRALFMKKD